MRSLLQESELILFPATWATHLSLPGEYLHQAMVEERSLPASKALGEPLPVRLAMLGPVATVDLERLLDSIATGRHQMQIPNLFRFPMLLRLCLCPCLCPCLGLVVCTCPLLWTYRLACHGRSRHNYCILA